jgi:hypothetical protein
VVQQQHKFRKWIVSLERRFNKNERFKNQYKLSNESRTSSIAKLQSNR